MTGERTIAKARAESLWTPLEQIRSRGMAIDYVSAVRHLRETGEQLTVSELIYLQQRIGEDGGPFAIPQSVAQFFSHLIGYRRCGRILDPSGGFGLLGAWLAGTLPVERVDVISSRASIVDIVTPLNLKTLRIHVGTLGGAAADLDSQYDAIVASPPVGLRSEKRSVWIDGDQCDLVDDPSRLLIAELAPRLTSEGFLAFVVTPTFARPVVPSRQVRVP